MHVTPNSHLSSLVGVLLQAYPSKRRPEGDLAEMDAQDALRVAGYDMAHVYGSRVEMLARTPGGRGQVVRMLRAMAELERRATKNAAECHKMLVRVEEQRRALLRQVASLPAAAAGGASDPAA